ncbi:MAG: SusC/RagA family TonB-linked outer membrane protein, partial [Flavobacterium psychrophilum]
GVDFAFRNNILTGSIEYYKKKGVDLIGDALIDPTTGVSTIRGNFSNMETKGVDIQLNSKNIDQTLKWNTSFIFNYTTEKITKYDIPQPIGAYFSAYKGSVAPIVGYPLRGIFSYKWGGLDPTTGDPRIILGDTLNKNYTATTTNVILPSDLVYSGRYNPPFAGSILNSFSWKGVLLSFNITYKMGHYFRRGSINYSSFTNNNWRAGHKDFALRWSKPGDELITDVPSLIYPETSSGRRDQFYNNSTILIEKADHIRLQYVNVGYAFSENLLRNFKFKSLNVFFYVNNLGIIWRANKQNIDPDYPYLNYPPSRSFSFGIKAGL